MVIVVAVGLAQASAREQVSEQLPGLDVLAQALLVLAVAYAVARGLGFVLAAVANRLLADRFRVTTLIPLVRLAVYGVALWVVALTLFELSATQVVAFSGVLGAVLGFGLRDLLADVVGGVVLVAERPYQIGDKISVDGHYGEVTDIGIRSTELVTPTDTEVTVPNYLFFDESVANASAGAAEMLVAVDFYVATDADVTLASEIVEEAMATSQYVYVTDDHPVVVELRDELNYRRVRGKAYVNDLRNEYPFRTDVTERALAAFEEHGIESPRMPAAAMDAGTGE